LILCGDFNSEPHSAVYEYLVSGCIEGDHYPELDNLDNNSNNNHHHGSYNGGNSNYNGGGNSNNSNNVRVLPSNLRSIVHDVDLASVMNTVIGSEPNFTNFTAKFKGTLDYIFYTPARLRVMAASSMPEEHDIRALSGEGLPSTCYPSDHMVGAFQPLIGLERCCSRSGMCVCMYV
jgi:CCR4-NOT transcription complex subunit 6